MEKTLEHKQGSKARNVLEKTVTKRNQSQQTNLFTGSLTTIVFFYGKRERFRPKKLWVFPKQRPPKVQFSTRRWLIAVNESVANVM